MATKLYLMRHGQTRFNQQGRIQGACDSPLTDLGKEQALAAHQYFQEQGIEFDKMYSSTQERACDTSELDGLCWLKRVERTRFLSFRGSTGIS